jgi:hypothetical protein
MLQVVSPRELEDLAQQLLSQLVAGMGLAGEDDLNGAVRIAENVREAFRVTQEQRRALVGDESPDEANGERVGVKERIRGGKTRRINTAAGKLFVAANPRELDEPGARPTLCIPERPVVGSDQ